MVMFYRGRFFDLSSIDGEENHFFTCRESVCGCQAAIRRITCPTTNVTTIYEYGKHHHIYEQMEIVENQEEEEEEVHPSRAPIADKSIIMLKQWKEKRASNLAMYDDGEDNEEKEKDNDEGYDGGYDSDLHNDITIASSMMRNCSI